MVIGSVYIGLGSTTPTFETRIADYSLVTTPELRFLTDSIIDSGYASANSLQDAITASNGTLFRGLLNNATAKDTMPLTTALEQLFQMTVMSMMSEPHFQYA